MSPTDNCLTRENCLRYLKKEMDPEELTRAEAHMADCELCETAVKGIGFYLEDHSTERLESCLNELEERIRERKNVDDPGKAFRRTLPEYPEGQKESRGFVSRRMWTGIGIAASFLVLVGIGTVITYMVRQRNQEIAKAEMHQKEEQRKDRTAVQYLPSPNDLIFNEVEESPAFPGGDEAMSTFLAEKISCPSGPDGSPEQTSLFVHFVVEEDGSVTNVKLVREMGTGCADEVIRGIESMPKWIPGKQGGEAVRVGFILMLKFS